LSPQISRTRELIARRARSKSGLRRVSPP
jgi:hypothetical protein